MHCYIDNISGNIINYFAQAMYENHVNQITRTYNFRLFINGETNKTFVLIPFIIHKVLQIAFHHR